MLSKNVVIDGIMEYVDGIIILSGGSGRPDVRPGVRPDVQPDVWPDVWPNDRPNARLNARPDANGSGF